MRQKTLIKTLHRIPAAERMYRPVAGTPFAVVKPLVSVVVSAYTDERFGDLVQLLESLDVQSYHNFETIIVLEKSRELLKKLQRHIKERHYLNIRLLFNNESEGLSCARNLGLKAAAGDVLAFIDDDAVASPDWLRGIINTYSCHPDAIGVTGPVSPLWEHESMDWFPRALYWIFACTDDPGNSDKATRNGYGTNMSFKKEAFQRCGCFDEHLGAKGGGPAGKNELVGEETEFSIRVSRQTGLRIFYSPGVLVQHRVYRYRFTRKFVARRSYWEGYTKGIFKKLDRDKNRDALSREHALLKNIILWLIPSTIIGIVPHPRSSLKRLGVTVMVLACVAYGYLCGSFHRIEKEAVP